MLIYALTLIDDPDDRPLFCKMYEHYGQKLYTVALGMLGSAQDAEDAVMNAWERVIRHFSTAKKYFLKSRSLFTGWLVIIVKNIARDELRRRKKTAPLPEDWDLPSGEHAEDGAALRALIAHIRAMPEGSRAVLELRLVGGYPFEEIGKIVGCSEDAARMRYHRGLSALKDKLREEGYEYEAERV